MIRCPSCDSAELRCFGEIEPIGSFAGKTIFIPLYSKYYKCLHCNLYFKHPLLTNEYEKELYQLAGKDGWHYDVSGRRDWQVALKWMSAQGNVASVLDVGCWHGDFLDHVGAGRSRFGVEINEEAVRIASSRGIEIVGTNAYDIPRLDRTFDFITAFDVIEHLHDPFRFVRALSDKLAVGGYMVIASGNAEALIWRILRNRYWYCAWPEHASFISRKWCEYAAEKIGLNLRHSENFSHVDRSFSVAHFSEFAINLSYALFPGIHIALRKMVYGRFSPDSLAGNVKSPPPWATRKDHIVVVFRKDEGAAKPSA